jgi:hypothetical protein
MDNLAAEVLRQRCSDPDRACWEEAETAEAIHNARIQVNREPVFQDACLIEPGHHAAELVRWLYLADPYQPSAAKSDECPRHCYSEWSALVSKGW